MKIRSQETFNLSDYPKNEKRLNITNKEEK